MNQILEALGRDPQMCALVAIFTSLTVMLAVGICVTKRWPWEDKK